MSFSISIDVECFEGAICVSRRESYLTRTWMLSFRGSWEEVGIVGAGFDSTVRSYFRSGLLAINSPGKEGRFLLVSPFMRLLLPTL